MRPQESGTSTDHADEQVLRPLLVEIVKGALIGAAWAVIASRGKVRHAPLGDLALFFAILGSTVFGLRFLFSEVSEKGTVQYYLVWSITTSLGSAVASIPSILNGSAGSTGVKFLMLFGALGGVVFGFIYARFVPPSRGRTKRSG